MNFIVLIEEFNNYDTGEERFIVKKVIEYKTEIYETEDDNIDGYVVPSGWKLRDSELIDEMKLKDYKWIAGDDEGINIEYDFSKTTVQQLASNIDSRLIINSSDSVYDNLNKSVIYSVVKSIKDGYKYDFTNNDNVKFTPLAYKSKINTDEFLYMKADNVDINGKNQLKTQKITIRTLQPNKIISSSFDFSFKKSKIKILPIDVFNDNRYHIDSNKYFKLSDIISDARNDPHILLDEVLSFINIHDGNNIIKSDLVGLGLNWSNLFKQIVQNQYDFLFNFYYVYDTGIVIECEMVFYSTFYGNGGGIGSGGIFVQPLPSADNDVNSLFFTPGRINGSTQNILFPLLNTIRDIKNQYNSNTNMMNSINTKGPEGLHIPIYNGIGYANSVSGETVPISDLKTLKIPRSILHYYYPGGNWDQSVLETLISRYTNSPMNDFIDKLKDLQYSYLSINSDIELVESGTPAAERIQKRLNLHTEFDFSNSGGAIFSDNWTAGYTLYDTVTGIRVWKIDDFNEFKLNLSKESFKKVNY